METYIAILRGINVSGHRKIAMADLKRLLEEQDFKNVGTYIQSGNVVFQADNQTEQALARRLQGIVEKAYGFDVPVLVRTAGAMKSVWEHNPFLQREGIDPEKLHVTFLADIPADSALEKIKLLDFQPDKFQIIGREVYLYCPGGYGNTKLSNTFFENKLKVQATTRNWKTVQKLLEMAS